MKLRLPKLEKKPPYYIQNTIYQMSKLDDAEHIILPEAVKKVKKGENVIIYRCGF